MIIELSASFDSLEPEDWPAFIPAIETCLFAHRQGWHIFAPKRRIIDNLMELACFSANQRSLLGHQIRPNIATLLGQARTANVTILGTVGPGDLTIPEMRHRSIDLRLLANADNIQKSRLLVEDQVNDGGLILLLAKLAGKKLGHYGPLALEVIHGGGGRISNIYRSNFDDVRPLLCIVDSDKLHKSSRVGMSAAAAIAVGEINQYRTVELSILPTREAENLIPLSFLFDVFANDGLVRKRISCFHRFLNVAPQAIASEVFDFLDLKQGMALQAIALLPDEVAEKHALLCSEFDREFNNGGSIMGVSQKIIPMLLRLIEMSPRYEERLSEKFLALPNFERLEELLHRILSFGASAGRLPLPL